LLPAENILIMEGRMNEKNNFISFVVKFLFLIVFICTCFGSGYWFRGYQIHRANSADNNGAGSIISRERELFERIGEYQRREADRLAAEGERIKRTENAIGAIWESDRRSGDLHEELKQEVKILADYFRGSCDIFINDINNLGSE
jgi:hypothetical protein